MKKLVRDKIIEIIKKKWEDVNFYNCDEIEFKKRLFEKLLEESKEVMNSSNKDELKEELADVLEVFYYILKEQDINFEEIENIRKNKKEEKWWFDKKIVLDIESLNRKRVFLLKWWESKENYSSYDDFVRQYEVSISKDNFYKWSDNLQNFLGSKFDVIEIERFNKGFADYKIWKIVFEKYLDKIKFGDILVWHSLWWSFFLKYFCSLNKKELEKIFSKISKLILVAPAIEDTDDEVLWNFKFDYKNDLKKISDFWDKIFILASEDDFVVPFEEAKIIEKYLPTANYLFFKDKWHFLVEKFPELVDLITK